jgi:PAS domain S-box-containing protein
MIDTRLGVMHSELQRRVERLQQAAAHGALQPQTVIQEALVELAGAIEELRVAEEELEVQSAQLTSMLAELDVETRRYQALFQLAPDAYVVTDARGMIQETNHAAGRLFDVKPGYLTGKPLALFIGHTHSSKFYELLGKLKTADQKHWHAAIRPHQGPDIPVSVACAPVRDDAHQIISLHWLIRDIREQHKLEEERAQLLESERTARAAAEEADASKVKFLAMIAHELRTPLTSIRGFASTLLASDVTWDARSQREFLQIISEESDKLTALVDELLDLSRLEAGTLHVNPVDVSVRAILDSAMAEVLMLTIDHELRIDVPPDLPSVIADPIRVAQVLGNLIGNAAKFSPRRSRILISAHRAGDYVQVDISDGGPGIAPEHREAVFELFLRPGHAASGVPGTGLGLAISRGLIETQGGRLWIQDTDRPGATVSFTLPLSTPHPEGA